MQRGAWTLVSMLAACGRGSPDGTSQTSPASAGGSNAGAAGTGQAASGASGGGSAGAAAAGMAGSPSDGCFASGGCSPLEYCDHGGGACDGAGICTKRPDKCVQMCAAPVLLPCGCDGNAYCSVCEARSFGVDVSGDICGGWTAGGGGSAMGGAGGAGAGMAGQSGQSGQTVGPVCPGFPLQAESPWPMPGGCPSANGRSAFVGPSAPNVKWSVTASATFSAPTIAADGSIYAPAGNRLRSLHPDGSDAWSFEATDMIGAPTIGMDGMLYLGSQDKHVYALYPDGTKKWSVETKGFVYFVGMGPDGTLYAAGGDLYAIGQDGVVHWAYPAVAWFSGPTVASDGTIYAFEPGATGLHALGPDGTEKWEAPLPGSCSGGVSIGTDGVLNAGACGIAPDGLVKWAPKLAYETTPGAIGPDGTVYCGGNGWLHAFTEGVTKWEVKVGAFTLVTPLVDAAGTVYVEGDTSLVAVGADGTTKWSLPVGFPAVGATIGRDGTLYVARGGMLSAIQP